MASHTDLLHSEKFDVTACQPKENGWICIANEFNTACTTVSRSGVLATKDVLEVAKEKCQKEIV